MIQHTSDSRQTTNQTKKEEIDRANISRSSPSTSSITGCVPRGDHTAQMPHIARNGQKMKEEEKERNGMSQSKHSSRRTKH
jgi:hypothetical protein